MEKRVRITIVGSQKFPGAEPVKIEFVTFGTLCRYGAKLRVSYQESDLMGMNGVCTTFVYEDSSVSMERSGKLSAKMRFQVGEKTKSMYDTEYGTMILGITARKVICSLNDNGGKIYLQYGVELNGQHIGLNSFDISVEPVPEAQEDEEEIKEESGSVR